ncbi:MAG: DUF5686 family protein [Cytophagaceae bacterium]
MRYLKVLGLFLSLLISPDTFCQSQIIKGKVTETFSKVPLAFVHITINDQIHMLSDEDGKFTVNIDQPVKKISFKRYMYRTVYLYPPLDSSIQVSMNLYLFFIKDTCSNYEAANIINRVIDNKQYNYHKNYKYHSYKSYNKFIITATDIEKSNRLLRKMLKTINSKLIHFREDQHFLIIEAVTEKKYRDNIYNTEEVRAVKASAMDVPGLVLQSIQNNSVSAYDDYLSLSGTPYIGPLAPNTFKRYIFNVIDTIPLPHDTLYIIKYNARPERKFDMSKGFLYISKNNYNVSHLIAMPDSESSLSMELLQTYEDVGDAKYFPVRTKTIIKYKKGTDYYTATNNTWLFDIKTRDFVRKKSYTKVALKYPFDLPAMDEEYWEKQRRENLKRGDSLTYSFFEALDAKGNIEKLLRIGENVYYGTLPVNKINVDLDRILNFNEVEGTRIGIGAHTNHKFSNRIIVGGYYGYGLRDKKSKYGADGIFYFSKEHKLGFFSRWTRDLKESGGTFFPFDRYQYTSEPLRLFRLRILDLVTEAEHGFKFHSLRNFDAILSWSIASHRPTYDYIYQDAPRNDYGFTEIRLGFRYAFGEKYLRIENRETPLPTKYPIVYFLYTQGIKGPVSGDFSYTRYDLKIEQNIKFLDYGKTGIQLVMGYVPTGAPYMKLYNGRGSFKNLSVVIHNSFETMGYNEFLMDRYAALFVSHDFGKFYLTKSISPSLWILHNSGYGSLSNPEHHVRIPFKTMEKGYHETGSFLNNIVVVNLMGLKTGVGAGFLYRYGYYVQPKLIDNFVFKFSVNFFL